MGETLDLLKDLIRCAPVTAEVANVNRATRLLADYLSAAGLSTVIEDVDGREVLYASTCPGETPDTLLNAHVDVVPASDPAQHEPREEAGWLVARGGHDCLGHAALAARLLVRLRDTCRIGAFFSADEEVGGATTAAMVERGYGAKRLILVLDGAAYAIAIAQKGIITARLVAEGTACHASTPWKGENAIDKLIDGYQRVRGLFDPVEPGDEWHNTMVAACLEAGTVANRVPDRAEMTLNIRFTEPGGEERILEQLRELSGLPVEVVITCPPVVFDERLPVFGELAEAMRSHFDREIGMVRMNGATDARHFVGLDVPVAIIGSPGRDVHGAAEAVEIAGLEAYEEMLVAFLG